MQASRSATSGGPSSPTNLGEANAVGADDALPAGAARRRRGQGDADKERPQHHRPNGDGDAGAAGTAALDGSAAAS